MINRNQILTSVAAFTLLTISAPATASDNDELEYDSDVKACIAEIGDHANYEGATRVQHIVVMNKRPVFGYRITIDTSVYTKSDGTAVREYASYCDAIDDDKPVKFRIREISA